MIIFVWSFADQETLARTCSKPAKTTFLVLLSDQIDANGNAIDTWNFAYVFDDKQRIYYDKNLEELLVEIEVIISILVSKFEALFSENSAVTGLEVGGTVSSSSGGSATITEVNFDEGTNLSGSFILEDVTGAILRADTITYDDNGNPATLIADRVNSQRIEVEVVSHVTSHTLYSVLSVEARHIQMVLFLKLISIMIMK